MLHPCLIFAALHLDVFRDALDIDADVAINRAVDDVVLNHRFSSVMVRMRSAPNVAD